MEKDRNITASLLLIYILIFSNFASAQKKEYAIPEEQKKFSVSLFGGGGIFFNGISGLSSYLSAQYYLKNTFVELQAGGLGELSFLGTDYHDAIEISLLYGIKKRIQKWKLEAAAGAGFYSYAFHQSKTIRKNTVGFPLKGKAIFQPKRFGVGIQLSSNFNNQKSFGAIGLVWVFRF